MNSQFTIAVHCLVVLAQTPDQVWNSESLSQKVHTHPARVRKIMGVLRNNGLVETKEGLGGGYRIGCDAGACTLARIYQSVSCEPLKLTWNAADCDQADPGFEHIRSAMDVAFNGAERSLENYLEQWSIARLISCNEQAAAEPQTPQMEKNTHTDRKKNGGEGKCSRNLNGKKATGSREERSTAN